MRDCRLNNDLCFDGKVGWLLWGIGLGSFFPVIPVVTETGDL